MVNKALILVDIQNDFCTGSMAVAGSDAIVAVANALQPHFELVVATQDWHPHDHISFATNHPGHQVGDVIVSDQISQVLWPNHCEQNSQGAAFHPNLETAHIKKIFHKGIDKKIDSYSAFFDNAHRRSTGLADYLHSQQVKEVYIMGLVTDYCVKYSSLDAVHSGFQTYVILDGCRSIELNSGDTAKAIEEMHLAGVQFIQSQDILKANQ